MDQALPTNCLTLEEVKKAFDSWRETQGRRSKIPNTLWDLVRPLQEKHKRCEIYKALSINTYQFNDYVLQQSASSVTEENTKTSTFVEMPASFLQNTSAVCVDSIVDKKTIEIIRHDGTRFILKNGTVNDLTQTIELFLRQ
jgi:hypothetical protein